MENSLKIGNYRNLFIDNLRWIFVLLLFPYHTFMVYNTFGESFYIKGADIQATTNFIMVTWPWFMPLLFLIAGVSSAYSLNTRTMKNYIKERIFRLLIPLCFGLLFLVPIQTYFAERFHNNYSGSYFEQYILFFTKSTDLSGYHGGFTPAHLWFILYLFIISLIALPIIYIFKRSTKKLLLQKIPQPVLLLLFIIPIFSQIILDINGKSLGEYLTYFLFGYYFISCNEIQEKLQKYRFFHFSLAILCMIIYIFVGTVKENYNIFIYELLYSFYVWTTIMTILGFGRKHLNFTNSLTAYMSKSSFPVYFFHQQWIVVTAYFSLLWIQNIPLQMITILLASIIFTLLTYEVFKRFSITRFFFAIKK